MFFKRRFVMVMLAVLIMTSCFSGMAYAQTNETEAIRGTPTLDGAIDPIWEGANIVKTDKWASDEGYATAEARTMWDDDYFYVLMQVTDKLLSDASANPWEKDSVEVFFDELNEKAEAYDGNDGQYRVNYKNETSGGGVFNAETFKSAAAEADGGYIVEMAIPWTELKGKVAADTIVGFDAQVNDDALGTGVRSGIVCWNDNAGDKYCNASTLGNVKLVGGSDVPVSAEPAAGDDVQQATDSNDNSGDSIDSSKSNGDSSDSNGNSSNTVLWIVITCAVVIGFAVIIIAIRKKATAK